ncbi:MAG TPA: hypothetical protein VEK56_07695, partial [Vicinamibacterales bacterium]|nr:hypothetical protein [Vicinamibacterales bacterium]
LGFFFLRAPLGQLFNLAAPEPAIYADLTSIFLVSVGVGYLLPYRDPSRYRVYLWLFGVILKSAGAAAFALHYVLGNAPASFLIFAASDAIIACLTLAALGTAPAEPPIERNA